MNNLEEKYDIIVVGAGHAGFAYAHQNAEQHDDADRAHQIGLFGGKHCFLHEVTPSRFPVRPSGRTA